MLKTIKKTVLIFLINTCLVHNATCGSMGESDSEINKLGGSITGLYLQPSTDFLEYAVITSPFPIQAGNWFPRQVNPHYRPTFAIDLNYNLPDAKIKLDWLHFYASYTANTTPGARDFVGPNYYFGPHQGDANNTFASSDMSFKLDHINLLMSTLIHTNKTIELEPFWGLSAANIINDTSNLYKGTGRTLINYTHTVSILSYFKGTGPRFGIDGRYFIKPKFGINTLLSGSLLVGKASFRTTFASTGTHQITGVKTSDLTTFANQNQTSIVPELNTQIGLFYNSQIMQKSTLTIQLGYLFTNYFNAIYQDTPTGLVNNLWNDGVVAVTTKAHTTSNLSFNGPYLTLLIK